MGEEMFNRTNEYLRLVGNSMVFIPPKFCRPKVNFSSFTLGHGNIKLMKKHLEAIADSPRQT